MPFSRYFARADTTRPTHAWSKHTSNGSPTSETDLAAELAEQIVRLHARGCPQHYEAWRERVLNGAPLSSQARAFLEALAGTSVGLPTAPRNDDHVEGFVAEHLWYFLTLEDTSGDPIIHMEPPGLSATDPGGDGFVVHSRIGSALMFRLWEIKKFTGGGTVSATITRAYDQLSSRAERYLLRYTVIGEHSTNPHVKRLCSQLVDHWVDGNPEAAAGIAVTSSIDSVPKRCFARFGKKFPRFKKPRRLLGMITATTDFSAFAKSVRDNIWNGL
jgi:hypothetical protein